MLRLKQKNKKGIFGLDTVQNVMIFLILLAVVAIALFTGVTTLSSEDIIARKAVTGQTFSNETITFNLTGNTPATVNGLTSVVLSNVIVTNSTGGQIILAANYTISAGTITGITTSTYNNTLVNVSATYSHTIPSDAVTVSQNITDGTTGFFKNIPTIFTILGAVLIISVVVLILIVVSRFTGVTRELQ